MKLKISKPGHELKFIGSVIVGASCVMFCIGLVDLVLNGSRGGETQGLLEQFGMAVAGGLLGTAVFRSGCQWVRANAKKEVPDRVYVNIRDYCSRRPESQAALKGWLQVRGRGGIVWSELESLEGILSDAEAKSARGSVLTANASP